MNTPVSFELAKLLKEKGFDAPKNNCDNLIPFYHENEAGITLFDWFSGKGFPESLLNHKNTYSAPTIADVVMRLYEKHGIWIVVNIGKPHLSKSCMLYSNIIKFGLHHKNKHRTIFYNTPKEAYESGITYTLKNLI